MTAMSQTDGDPLAVALNFYFDAAQANIVYAKKALDLTDVVMQQLEGQLQKTNP